MSASRRPTVGLPDTSTFIHAERALRHQHLQAGMRVERLPFDDAGLGQPRAVSLNHAGLGHSGVMNFNWRNSEGLQKAWRARGARWVAACYALAAVGWVVAAFFSGAWWQWAIAVVWVVLAYTWVQGYLRYGRGYSGR